MRNKTYNVFFEQLKGCRLMIRGSLEIYVMHENKTEMFSTKKLFDSFDTFLEKEHLRLYRYIE